MTQPPGRAKLAVLTGEVRAGKTTAAVAVVELAREAGHLRGGFLSPDRLGPGGEKVGIDALSLADGERRPLASIGEDLGGPRVGPYSFDQASLDWAMDAFRRALGEGRDLLVADELGRLEIERGEGFAPLLPILAAGEARRALVVARLGPHERLRVDPERVELRVFTLTADPGARNQIPREVFEWLFARDPSAGTEPTRWRFCRRGEACG